MTNITVDNINQVNDQDWQIRPIESRDNVAVAEVIRSVSAEYGLTADKGYGVADPSLDDMAATYAADGWQYWVIEHQGKVLGGAGIAPLSSSLTQTQSQTNTTGIAELQKMYFSKAIRGKKLALPMFEICQQFAISQGYSQLYLETTALLPEALNFYNQLGFKRCQHLGDTGHDACEVAMILPLTVDK
ncbi:GNAT family N-acetyltransferase [Shewanella sp. WXL01]|uniref:GNAT family N-acetyltransferase n=1 Tax=Shewanella sp. WXL01 TaxID=2709721 RepID=UPI00143837C8|nr:GNAT family N-acetyltransferase [Shewanella sp. WXL01]NKF50752.1 GNAT family N-acetyltransferase [Shewanella sp. WXL01]